jgi:hypothetical protein
MDQHEKHVGRRRGFEVRHVKRNTVHARGVIAYATAYSVMEERGAQLADRDECNRLQGKIPGRPWRVEALRFLQSDFGGVKREQEWVMADRSMQGATREEAMRLISGLEDRYRVMVRDSFGGWKRHSAPRSGN